MSGTLFNIEDSIMIEFRKNHKGDMSKIVSELIGNYISIKKENLQLKTLKDKLTVVQEQIVKLKQEESNIKLFIKELEDEYTKEIEKAKEVDIKIVQWARDCIRDAKEQGTLTELRYTAEKAGFTNLEDYLVKDWEKSQK